MSNRVTLVPPSNIVSTSNGSADATTKYFNNYFTPNYSISSNANNAIVSFFETMTGSTASAVLLAQALINSANAQRENPLVLLDSFKKMSPSELTPLLTLYLNSTRVPTSLLGIKNPQTPSQLIARKILV